MGRVVKVGTCRGIVGFGADETLFQRPQGAKSTRILVVFELLQRFCGVCVSLTLALARLYTRSFYFEILLGSIRVQDRRERKGEGRGEREGDNGG